MKFKHNFSYLLRKYASLRLLCIVTFCLVILGFSALVSYSINEKPVILSISQQVGAPGDIISIRGKFFNNKKDSSYVEIAGNRLTESSYVSWTNDEIIITIPANTQDGLLYVVSKSGKSNPDFFANKSAIPVSISQSQSIETPVIISLSQEKGYIGDLLTIQGKNFGSKTDTAKVWFTTKKTSYQIAKNDFTTTKDDTTEYICASEIDYDYDYWSENEIRVFIPDGATTGYVYVETDTGKSTRHAFEVQQRAGTKEYITKTTYVLQVASDVSNIKGTKDSTLCFRLPIPPILSEQPSVILTEQSAKPLLDNYDNTAVYQLHMDNLGKDTYATQEKTTFSQNYAITVKSVETNIDVNYVTLPKNRKKLLYQNFTKKDNIIPADEKELVDLLPNVIYKSVNPYRQAKLIFDYMANNYKVEQKLKKADSNCLDILKSKKGDAYDLTVLYCALLRTCGVPAKLMSGVLVDANKNTKAHWWVNFYIENFGWVPADIALACGLEYESFTPVESPKSYYFGNLDSQHICFSQNLKNIRGTITNGKTVSIPKTYALQTIWEESSVDVTGYSSLWNPPNVIGIY